MIIHKSFISGICHTLSTLRNTLFVLTHHFLPQIFILGYIFGFLYIPTSFDKSFCIWKILLYSFFSDTFKSVWITKNPLKILLTRLSKQISLTLINQRFFYNTFWWIPIYNYFPRFVCLWGQNYVHKLLLFSTNQISISN